VQKFFEDYERTWAAWGTGPLGAINHDLAAGRNAVAPADLRPLFLRAEEARKSSGGRFDARIGALTKLWGFDDESHLRSEPPAAAEVQRLRAALAAAPGFTGGIYGPAAVQWDFGGIAKGAAVEEAVARFKAAGIANVIVNAGGNLRTSGKRGSAPWRIGIRHPRGKSPDEVIAWLVTDRDEAIMTSGDYERFFEYQGQRYCHILDPATGAPARGLRSVTVIHADAAWADAASTAVFVAGPERWREVAKAFGIEQALAVTESGELQVTAALNARLKYPKSVQPRVLP
jgi:thiamine biosynthesis lipoprotein